ncbi:TetR/AcrR family transcriptional regulator [Rhodococcus opacus]|nr:TetR/AcrR family transcriptional regulator [Rhodococcus opacus]
MKAAFELAQRDGAAGLTMRRLGEELKVDATTLYRLFRDRDELLLAVHDHATAVELEEIGEVPDSEHWQDTLRRIADRIWATAVRSPAIAALTFARTTGGPAERRMVELILETFARSGLSREATVRYYRVFADATLGLAGQVAVLATLAPEIQAKDAASWTRIHAHLPDPEYPTARAQIAELTSIDRRTIYDLVVEAVLAAAERESAESAWQIVSGLERHRSFRHNTHGVVSDADADAVIEAVYDREHADDIGGCSYRADQFVSDGFLCQRLHFPVAPSFRKSIPPDTHRLPAWRSAPPGPSRTHLRCSAHGAENGDGRQTADQPAFAASSASHSPRCSSPSIR